MLMLRCRKVGVVVTNIDLSNYDIVWKRIFTPNTSPIDAKILRENPNMKTEINFQTIIHPPAL
jgi:hypothetical protein